MNVKKHKFEPRMKDLMEERYSQLFTRLITQLRRKDLKKKFRLERK